MKSCTIQWQRVCRSIFFALALCSIPPGCLFATEPVSAVNDSKTILIRAGAEPVLRYRYGDVRSKPYVKELFTPAGVNILLDSPPDHVHHRGLMFAIGVDGVDFWSETATCGRQKHVSLAGPEPVKNNMGRSITFTEAIDWVRPDSDKALLREKRTITAGRADNGNATFITWRSVFNPAEGIDTVKIDGRHYFGLGMRFIGAMDAAGTFLNADNAKGKTFRGDEKLLRSRWCAYTVRIDGKPVTVAMFDAPENRRHPATWFTMRKPFAYLSATMGLHEEPFYLRRSRQLDLRYAVVLWDAEVKPEKIEEIYRQYVRSCERGAK